MKRLVVVASMGALAIAVAACDGGGRTVHLGNETDPGGSSDKNLSIVDPPLPVENGAVPHEAEESHAGQDVDGAIGNNSK